MFFVTAFPIFRQGWIRHLVNVTAIRNYAYVDRIYCICREDINAPAGGHKANADVVPLECRLILE